ncbi:MAG TPA: globin family protein [Verrucomicrobiae bacterium]|nr:globin family protein [Verrucomicrobiae bacterium]
MTPRQIQLIRETYAVIEPRAAIAGLVFYQRLFTLNPSLRALFTHDINEQAVKLMQALRFAIASVEQPRELQPVLESLGRRHVYYGVEDRHYETVGAALMGTLAVLLGAAFTPEVKEAWSAIYTFMADTMKRAAAKESREGNHGMAGVSTGLEQE